MSANGTGPVEHAHRNPLGARAEHGAQLAWEQTNLSRQTTDPATKRAAREEAALYARVAEVFAQRDVAEASRDLARAQNQLAVSVEVLVEELRIARGARADLS